MASKLRSGGRRSGGRRRRSPALWPLVVLVLLFLGGAVLSLVDFGDDGRPGLEREGSARLGDGRDLRVASPPRSYRVTYRVRQPGGDPTTETLWVGRPFDGRVEIRRGSDGTGDLIGERESTLGHLAIVGSEDPFVLVVGPRLSAPDLRIDPVLAAAEERGPLERRERREVAGRECQVYRAGGPVIAGDLDGRPTEREYADACFDESGILLEEWWVSEGRPIRQRVAIDVEVGVNVEDALRLPEDPTLPPEQGGGGFTPVEPDSAPPGSFWVLDDDAVPEGFERLGRYSVVPTQAEAFGNPTRRSSIVASTADVWVRGPDLLVVEQGATLGGTSVFEPDPSNPNVDAGGLGTAELLLQLDRVEVRAPRPGGGFVRVYGTVPPGDITSVARALRAIRGTGLRPVD